MYFVQRLKNLPYVFVRLLDASFWYSPHPDLRFSANAEQQYRLVHRLYSCTASRKDFTIKNTLVGCFLNNLYDIVRILLFHKTKAVIESNNDSIRLLGKYLRLYLSWTARVWRLFTSASQMKVTSSVILVLVY